MNGLDHLLERPSFPHPGTRVGVLCHHASLTSQGEHLVDKLSERSDWQLTCIFSPEHGFNGTAAPGERIQHSRHADAGVTIYSLYGDTRSPRVEWLEKVDVVVIDLMDLGVRCYTYASSLMEMMKVCAHSDIPVVVLDRSTPLQGVVDGPELEPGFESFVGQVPLPLVFGKSQGELALFLRKTLPEMRHLKLEVVWADSEEFVPWTPPSPAIVSADSARCYPVTVWSEAMADIWVDRGGERSFQVWAMPDFPAIPIERYQNYGFVVKEDIYETPNGDWDGLSFNPMKKEPLRPVCLAHQLFKDLSASLGAARLFNRPGARASFFDSLAGTSSWRTCLEQGNDPEFAHSD